MIASRMRRAFPWEALVGCNRQLGLALLQVKPAMFGGGGLWKKRGGGGHRDGLTVAAALISSGRMRAGLLQNTWSTGRPSAMEPA